MLLRVNHFYRFGEFTVDADQRVLLREGQPVHLTPKVFDTLLILLENHQRIVEKEELMNRLWPDVFVEETNLTFNIQQLRKALGDRAQQPIYIETVARRGYRFIAEVEEGFGEQSRTNGQTQQSFETAAAQVPIATHELKSEPATAGPEHATQLPASSSVSKRPVAWAAVAVIALFAAGLVYVVFSNGAARVWGRNKIKLAAPLKLEKLTDTGQSRQVAISPDGKYIAYTRALKGVAGIWLRQLATNTNVEIVPPTHLIYGLAFAHSGEYLYFVRSDPKTLFRVSPLGGVPTKIVEKLEGNFAISPDDKQIAFVRWGFNPDGQREYSLMIANPDGTGERTLLVGGPRDMLDVPIWSPDGSAIICAQGYSGGGTREVGLIEVKVAEGTKKELSPARFFFISKLTWLPDKSGLLMSSRKNLADNNQLWRVSYPSMEMRQITEDLLDYLDLSTAAGVDKAVASQVTLVSDLWAGPSNEPRGLKKITQARGDFCWAPDGRLVYMSTASGNQDLWIMQADGTGQRQLTNHPAADREPTVTPDNRYIVFTSNRSGSSQVWRMNLDGSNQTQLTRGAAKWDRTAVSPDGRWVLYNTADDWQLWKVSIDGGEPVRLTEYYALRPTVSPDGKMIACMGRTTTKRELLFLPFEGGQPVKKLDYAGLGGTRLQWTSDGQALIYTAGWGGGVLVKQPLSGGQPQPIVSFDEDTLFDFGYSFDGKFLAVTRGNWQHDLVLLSDLTSR
jgi:Tol biopolymer transport system component/DNA-binding winged helix-turn-helix (wHTH) protein